MLGAGLTNSMRGQARPDKPALKPAPEQPRGATAAACEWFIDRLKATHVVARRERSSSPREFHIHRLVMSAVGADPVMTFQSALSNPRPAGEFETAGTFGPWQKDEPSLTPPGGAPTPFASGAKCWPGGSRIPRHGAGGADA
jgi:hypothetical protein